MMGFTCQVVLPPKRKAEAAEEAASPWVVASVAWLMAWLPRMERSTQRGDRGYPPVKPTGFPLKYAPSNQPMEFIKPGLSHMSGWIQLMTNWWLNDGCWLDGE